MDLNTVKDYLVEEGYRPVIDEDGDINFKSEGKFYLIDTYKDDEQFIRLFAPNIWEIENEEELKQALLQANRITCNLKSAKVFVIENQENVWASIEMFVADVDAFIAVFPRCLSVVAAAVKDFREGMRQMQSADSEEGALPTGRQAETRPLLH